MTTSWISIGGDALGASGFWQPTLGAEGEVTGDDAPGGEIPDEQTREARRSRLEAIFEASADGIIAATSDSIVTDWNPAAERVYGFSAAEIIGRPLSKIVPADGMEAWGELIARLLAGERVERLETERVRRDGNRIRVSLSLAPLHDLSGRVSGYSAIVRDGAAPGTYMLGRLRIRANR